MNSVRKRRLITNADDFGWSRGITDGILLAHREGAVTSTTLMVNQAASEYALESARQAPKLGIGVHLRLCDGMPVLPSREVRSLVDQDGKFYSISELRHKLWRGEVLRAEIEAEFRAQIRWLKDRAVVPTHADSHHHVHVHPRVAGPFCRALLAEGVRRARPAVQHCLPKNGIIAGAHAGPAYRRVLVQSYSQILQRTVFRALESPDYRLAAHPRYRGRPELLGEAWQSAIESIPPGTCELECHPGIPERGFSEKDGWRDRRQLELRLLTSPDLRLVIERAGVDLINYSQLGDDQ
jgi:chitin disaccharide deacetylase